jgi:hypothetical protein
LRFWKLKEEEFKNGEQGDGKVSNEFADLGFLALALKVFKYSWEARNHLATAIETRLFLGKECVQKFDFPI